MSNSSRYVLPLAALFLIVNVAINFTFFTISTVQGHIYILLLEAFLIFVIYRIAKASYKDDAYILICKKFVYMALFISGVSAIYKWLFMESLSKILYVEDFSHIFNFAMGSTYGLKPVADASIDVIANALYQCGFFCVREEETPLNEPFIAYLYYGISVISGEFNHAILWLTLHAANLLTAAVLLKTAREILDRKSVV